MPINKTLNVYLFWGRVLKCCHYCVSMLSEDSQECLCITTVGYLKLMQLQIRLNQLLHTCSVSLVSVIFFPSMSVGDMVTAPVAVASSDTSSCPSPLPTSGFSFSSALFLLEERDDEDPVILETVIRGDGLGDSLSLKERQQKVIMRHHISHHLFTRLFKMYSF